MFIPYCKIFNKIDVVHTLLCDDGTVKVHFEEPDAKYGFKELDCVIPSYNIVNVIGFDNNEVSKLINFCKRNAGLILSSAREGV